MVKKDLSRKPIHVYFNVVLILLAVIPIFYMVSLASKIPEYPWAIGFTILGIITESLLLAFPKKWFSDYIMIAGALILSAAFSSFLMGGVLSIADYIAGVNFWGDATQVPAIITYSCMLFFSACLSVVNCYIKD